MRKLLLSLLFCLVLTGCTAQAIIPRAGVYGMSVPPDTVAVPALLLDAETGFFAFSYDALASYHPFGSYMRQGNMIVLTTMDGLYTYRFRVVNETTLAFIAEGSADVSLTDPAIGAQITEGSVFLLREDE